MDIWHIRADKNLYTRHPNFERLYLFLSKNIDDGTVISLAMDGDIDTKILATVFLMA